MTIHEYGTHTVMLYTRTSYESLYICFQHLWSYGCLVSILTIVRHLYNKIHRTWWVGLEKSLESAHRHERPHCMEGKQQKDGILEWSCGVYLYHSSQQEVTKCLTRWKQELLQLVFHLRAHQITATLFQSAAVWISASWTDTHTHTHIKWMAVAHPMEPYDLDTTNQPLPQGLCPVCSRATGFTPN